MKCERCGYENYDESHYCKKCWAELANFDNEGSSDDLSRYKNRSNYQQTYNYKKNMYDGNNKYIRGLYNTDTNNNYTNVNGQYATNDSTQYGNNNGYNTQQYSSDNTFGSNVNYNSAGAYNEPVSKGTYNYYTEYSGQNSYRYSNYEGATDEESEKRKRRIRNIRNSTTIVTLIPVVLIAVFSVLEALDSVGINFFKESESPQVVESTTVQATEPTIPEAKLGHSMYSIADTDTQSVEVSYHPPKGYKFIDYGVDSCATFECEIYENKVSLTTMFFSGNIQEEIDYYESIGERDGTEVEISTIDTNIGKMVEIGVVTEGKGMNYQFYVEVGKDRYLYISMTNVPFAYAEDAETLLKLFMEDLEISYLPPVEEKTEAPT